MAGKTEEFSSLIFFSERGKNSAVEGSYTEKDSKFLLEFAVEKDSAAKFDEKGRNFAAIGLHPT